MEKSAISDITGASQSHTCALDNSPKAIRHEVTTDELVLQNKIEGARKDLPVLGCNQHGAMVHEEGSGATHEEVFNVPVNPNELIGVIQRR